MPDAHPSPNHDATPRSPIARRLKPPSWLDTRLVVGVLLVLASVVTGATVVSSADHRNSVWVLQRDLASGTVLTADDVKVGRVALGQSAGRYVSATESPAGRVASGALHAGELLPRAQLQRPADGIAVTIPLRAENSPRLGRGDRVTVWLSTRTCKGRVLISGVPVQEVRSSGGGAFSSSAGGVLVVRLSSKQADRIVGLLDLDGAVIRVGLLSAGEHAADTAPDLASCAAGGRS